jgi:O-antigen/teichoic acid export membrane protein
VTKKIKINTKKLLLWSQKFVKADMLYIARNGFWTALGQAVNGLLSLVLIIAFANLLPVDTYGLYRYILSIASVLTIFSLTGMNNAVSRTIARGDDGILKHAVSYQLKWHTIMLLAFFLLSGYYFVNDNIVLATSFFVLGTFMPSTLALNTYGAYLEGKREFKLGNILGILSTFIYSIGMLATLYLSNKVTWLITTYAIVTFIPSIIFYFYILHRFKPPLSSDPTETLEYGRRLTYIRLLGPIASQIDKIILAHFWGPAQLATYSLAAIVPNKGVPVLKKMVDIGFSKFAIDTQEKINVVFYRRIFQGAVAGMLLSVLYISIAPYLFKYLLPQYVNGVFYSQILSLCFIFALPTRYVSLLLEAQKMQRQTLFTHVTNSSLAIVLYIGFGTSMGLFGLTLAVVLHSFLGLLVNAVTWRISSKK